MTATEAEAKELVRDFTETLNAGNYDALGEFFADEYNELYDNDEAETVGEIIEAERTREAAISNKHEEIDVILTDTEFGEGTHLDTWYTVTGTHDGEILNLPPTGNDVKFPLYRFVTIEDGEIVRYRQSYTIGFLLDLGLDWQSLTEEVDMEQYMTTPEAAGSARAE